MKKIVYWVLAGLLAVFSIMLGYLLRQPKINELKEQVRLLQEDNSRLIAMVEVQRSNFRELLVQHKTLKALQFRKKAASKKRLTENLVMQYAVKEYITLLIRRVKYEQKLGKDEKVFFTAFDRFIDGKGLSGADKARIRDHIMVRHYSEIKQLRECEYAEVFEELQHAGDAPKAIACREND